jgi:hypothetical protein
MLSTSTGGRLTGVLWIICLLFAEPAAAADGPCGLETGTWASPADACQYALKPDEAIKRFGERVLIELHPGYYRYEGAQCTIFSNTLTSTRCKLTVECADGRVRTHGQFDIAIESARQFRFGTRPDSPIYDHCTGETPPR